MNLAKKSCALDPTPTPLLIKCIDVFLPVLTKMANISLESRHFPSAWKKAIHGMVPDYICKLISQRKSTGYSHPAKNLCLRFQPARYSQHLVVEHSVMWLQSSGTTCLAKYPASTLCQILNAM